MALLNNLMMKVAVIGAGIAGLSAIKGMTENGEKMEIHLYEAKTYPGMIYKSSGAIASYWAKKLQKIIKLSNNPWPIDMAVIHAKDEKINVISTEPIGQVISQPRLEYNLYLDIRNNCISHLRKYITTKEVEKLTKKFDYIIGADGVSSRVAKYLGVEIPKDEIFRCVEYWITHEPTKTLHIFFKEYCPRGYIWVIPEWGKIKVGLGIPMTRRENLEEILRKFPHEHKDFAGHVFRKVFRLVPSPTPLPSVVFDGKIALVGDAGRTVNPATGGGIHLAALSGYMAGKSLAEAGDFSLYEEYYRQEIYPELEKWHKIKKVLYKLSIDELAEVIKTLGKTIMVPEPLNPRLERDKILKFILKHPKLAIKIGRELIA